MTGLAVVGVFAVLTQVVPIQEGLRDPVGAS